MHITMRKKEEKKQDKTKGMTNMKRKEKEKEKEKEKKRKLLRQGEHSLHPSRISRVSPSQTLRRFPQELRVPVGTFSR